MKWVLYLALQFLFIFNLYSQNLFTKNTKLLNLGMGMFGYLRYWESGYSATPLINLSVDICVYEFPDVKNLTFGVGPFIGLRSANYTTRVTWKDKNNKFHYDDLIKTNWLYSVIAFRPTLNYTFEEHEVDAMVYCGIIFGFTWVNSWYSDPEYGELYGTKFSSYPDYGFFLGGRYFFKKTFAGFIELGYGASVFNVGLSFKI